MVSVPSSATALQAFRILITNNVNAAPVIDESGSVVATLSVSDIRYIVADVYRAHEAKSMDTTDDAT